MALNPNEFKLREKRDTTLDDRAWHTAMADPNSVSIAVGAAADGTWSFAVVPEDDSLDVPDPATFVRAAGETDAQIATAWALAINTASATGTALAKYVRSATASGTDVVVNLRRTAPTFGITVTSPAGTPVATPVDGHWPIARYVAQYFDNRSTKAVSVRSIPLDSNGNVIGVDTAATFSVRVLGGTELPNGNIIASHGTLETGVAIGEIRTVPWSGGLLGLECSAVDTPPTGLARLAFYVTPTDA